MTVLTLENTAIVADSTCDPPPGYFDHDNMEIVPLKVHFGDEAYRDLLDLGPDEFYDKLTGSAVLPTTSQPSDADFEAVYGRLSERYEHVFSFHLPRGLSGTVEVAERVGARYGVHVYDTSLVSTIVTLLIDRVRTKLADGIELGELQEYIARFCREGRLVFQVATLEYLRRGGRIGRAQSMIGDVFGIRPLIEVTGGELVPYAKVRGERRALEAMVGFLEKNCGPDDTVYLVLFHAAAPEGVAALGDALLAARPKAQVVLTSKVGAVIGTHAGPGTFAFGMIVE